MVAFSFYIYRDIVTSMNLLDQSDCIASHHHYHIKNRVLISQVLATLVHPVFLPPMRHIALSTLNIACA